MKSSLIRLGGLAAVLAGLLRVLATGLPASTPRIMTLYLVIDVLLLLGSIGLFEFQRIETGWMARLGVLLEVAAAVTLIARDFAILGLGAYPLGALMFAVGLDLFAIAAWKAETFPRWILTVLIFSTVVGPIGFFSARLDLLFAVSGVLFGIGFASAGIVVCLRRRHV